MNINRIKYHSRPDGTKLSVHIFVDKDGIEMRVLLHADGVTASLVTANNETPLVTVVASSPHKVRIKIKKALSGVMGIRLPKEKRKPRAINKQRTENDV